MLSDNQYLIRAAKKNYDLFKVPTSLVESKKTRRCYTDEEKSDLDVKTSVNKIGEIINLSQELNTLFWDKFNSGASFDEIADIYYDTSTLDVMSGIEIDKAKKEFVVDNAAEYRRLKEKYERRDERGRAIKPNFFGVIARKKGFYDNKKKCYKFHRTTMDYVQHRLNQLRFKGVAPANKPFIYMVDPILSCDWSKVNYKQIDRVIDAVCECRANIKLIWMSDMMDDHVKREKAAEMIESCSDYVLGTKMNSSTMYALLKAVDRQSLSDVNSFLFNILFGSSDSAFYQMINDSMTPIPIAVECLCGEFKLYDYDFTYHFCSPDETQKNAKIYKNTEFFSE